MTSLLYIVLPIVLLGVLISLVLGLKTLASGKEGSSERSNRLMQWRVGLQALAVVLVLALVALSA